MEPTWWGWAMPSTPAEPLSPAAREWLVRAAGWRPRHTPPVAESAVRLRPGDLDPGTAAALAGIVGPAHLRTDDRTRLLHTGGKSYVDLLRRRSGDACCAPDAVVLPAGHEQVMGVLAVVSERNLAVVPFGGGTSVVGGVEPERGGFRAVVALDLRRLDRLLSIDRDSLTATLQAGLRTPAAEELLGRHGCTLGHAPQSADFATIGGYAATRSAGAASTGFGRFDELVQHLRIATPAGELRLGHAPASAAGPDLRQLFLGSEGAFGVITEVGLRVRPVPPYRRYEAFSLPDYPRGFDAVRRLVQAGAAPDVLRLSDREETAAEFLFAGTPGAALRYLRARGHGEGVLMIAGWEGSRATARARRAAALRIIRAGRGIRLGTGPGRAWLRERFAAPYLRDRLMDQGLLVETLETAAPWSRLLQLQARLPQALRGALGPAVVMSHVSHVYPTGASLYLTVLADRDDHDPIGQWQRAKAAATAVIVGAGGTVTHHHGVGLEHRGVMPEEIGEVGVQVLRAVKAAVDPAGVLNPGKLIPPA